MLTVASIGRGHLASGKDTKGKNSGGVKREKEGMLAKMYTYIKVL